MELIASGREADVFVIDGNRILRRVRNRDTSCEREAAMMEWVRRQGYPVPQVFSVAGPDMVLQRVDGPTMVDSLLSGTTTPDDAGRTMAELHERLHTLKPPSGSNPDHVVRHLDLHPLNILTAPSGAVLIDWHNSDVGPGKVDVALTAVILAQVVLSPPPDAGVAERVPIVRELLEAFLRHAGPLWASDVEAAVRYRSHDANLRPAERAALASVPGMLL
ncbi:MAG: hypothetical protein QOI06_684 [Nocardioidaceae bacterium]|jgi:aminoglycoside phosphotransferase (APT) family kinase protein|nr:hypothetical protein [Nocardioidaceae bacterium]